MSIIGWIVFGLIAGFIASKIVTKQGSGIVLNIVLGIVGAVVGGFLMTILSGEPYANSFNLFSMVLAIIGAVIVLMVYHTVVGRRSSY